MYLKNVECRGRNLQFKVRAEHGQVSSTVCDEIVLREAFKENTYGLEQEHFRHTGVMIDVGANIGAVSLLAACLGAREVIAYEPEPENFGLLCDHVVMNRVGDVVQPVKKGIWSSAGVLSLVPSQGASTSRPEVVAAHQDMVVEIETITLAQALAPYKDVDVLKVDTEGAEYEFMTENEVVRKCRLIVMEYHNTTKEKFGNLLATMAPTHHLVTFGQFGLEGGQIVARRFEAFDPK